MTNPTTTDQQPPQSVLPSFLSSQPLEKGGHLIPDHQTQRFQSLLDDYSILRKLARVDTVNTDHFELLKDENTADCGWVSELADRNETQTPKLYTQKIHIHEMYAKPKVSQKLLEDSALDVESWLLNKVAEKMALLETEAFLYGSGDNQPEGLLEGIPSQALQNPEDLIKVQDQVHAKYASQTCWLMSPLALSKIRHMTDKTTGQFLWQPGLLEGSPQTLLGRPVYVCDQMGRKDEKHIVFGSFYHGYQIVDRLGLTAMRDPFSNKPFVEFYVRKRTGGALVDPKALCGLCLG